MLCGHTSAAESQTDVVVGQTSPIYVCWQRSPRYHGLELALRGRCSWHAAGSSTLDDVVSAAFCVALRFCYRTATN